MWIFTVFGDIVIHIIFSAGVILTLAGFVLGFIPFIGKYKIPLQLVGLLTLVFGAYLEGGLADNKLWEAKVKEVEAQVAKAEAQAANANTELQAKLTEKTTVIKEKGDTIIRYVDKFKDREVLKEVPGPERVKIEEVIKYVENCPLPKELIDIHNEAAKLNKGDKK